MLAGNCHCPPALAHSRQAAHCYRDERSWPVRAPRPPGPAARSSERLCVLQGRVGVLGVGTKAIAIGFNLAPRVDAAACFDFLAQRPRDVRRSRGLAATKPQYQNRGRCCGYKKVREAIMLEQLLEHVL